MFHPEDELGRADETQYELGKWFTPFEQYCGELEHSGLEHEGTTFRIHGLPGYWLSCLNPLPKDEEEFTHDFEYPPSAHILTPVGITFEEEVTPAIIQEIEERFESELLEITFIGQRLKQRKVETPKTSQDILALIQQEVMPYRLELQTPLGAFSHSLIVDGAGFGSAESIWEAEMPNNDVGLILVPRVSVPLIRSIEVRLAPVPSQSPTS